MGDAEASAAVSGGDQRIETSIRRLRASRHRDPRIMLGCTAVERRTRPCKFFGEDRLSHRLEPVTASPGRKSRYAVEDFRPVDARVVRAMNGGCSATMQSRLGRAPAASAPKSRWCRGRSLPEAGRLTIRDGRMIFKLDATKRRDPACGSLPPNSPTRRLNAERLRKGSNAPPFH